MSEKFMARVAILIVATGLTIWALQPYFESRAYNRLTGSQSTYWDAVFLQLRVEAKPINK